MQFRIVENRPLTETVWQMVLSGNTSAISKPGQFVQVQLPGFFLRRPISVCDWNAETLTLVYKVVGSGTEVMTTLPVGQELDLLTGLGNGFDTSLCGEHPLLVGGGVGLPPMVGLCRTLIEQGKKPTVLAGFGTAKELFLQDAVETLGAPFVVTTMDGTLGTKGVVTDALPGIVYDSVCACGPLPMLKALCNALPEGMSAQLSFEERMGCGFGACMGCTIKTKNGYKRVCKEGPVLLREEVLW